MLAEVCGDDEHLFEIQADMLDVERKFRGMTRRAGVYEALEDCLKAGQYESEEEAIRIRTEQEARLKAAIGDEPPPSPQKMLFEEPMF